MMPDVDTLTALDWHTVACQCDQHACTKRGGCGRPATRHIEFHFLDHCNQDTVDGDMVNPFGNLVFLLCAPCLATLEWGVGGYLRRLNRYGLATCATCGAPVVEPGDVIRAVKTL